ncbi:MAG TPA: DUF5666 domain-containing protein [Anaeromyxobacter sp.]|nr:DUF5666 domain-containing protein [Anaeromyxobacter sp.]
MTTTRKNMRALLAALTLVSAAACSGSSSSNDGGPGPAEVAATMKGAVQGFSGGLTVNGVSFRTSGATIRDDGGASSTLSGEDEVRGRVAEGEVVTVRGHLHVDDSGVSGHATEIEVHHSIEGEVESRSPGVIVVSGTAVSMDDSTFVADRHGNPLVSDDLAVGERVEISGHADGRGGVRATSIQESAQAAGSEREVRAWVVSVSGTVVELSFSRGGPGQLKVDVGGISPAPSVAAGTFVEVRTIGAAGVDGVFTATSIHAEDDLGPGAGERVEIEGIVTAVDATGFTVGSRRVEASGATELRGGTPEDLVVGVRLEVEGVLRGDGVLDAHEVKFRPSARVQANASAIVAAAGTFQVLGLAVHVTPSTELGFASLADLADGAFVEVRGYPTRDGAGLNATRVEVLGGTSDQAFLRGVVDAKTPTSSLEILGITIDTSAAQEFQDLADHGMTATAFFDAITPGQTVVKVRWRPYPSSTSAAVEQAELEN